MASCSAAAVTAKLCDKPGESYKSNLNGKCGDYRDTKTSLTYFNQMLLLAKCMAQDCKQSLTPKAGAVGAGNFCRFRDALGLCYVYMTAQMWCADAGSADQMCSNDGGANWAISPVGSAATVADTKWVPKQNAILYENSGDADKSKAGTTYKCACLKNCSCQSSKKCWCTTDADKTPIGEATDFSNGFSFNDNLNKRGECSCSCGGVLGV